MKKTKRIFMYLPAVFLMGVIFWFSSQPAEESSAESSRIVNFVLHCIENIRGFAFSSEEFTSWAEIIHTPIRKFAHMTEYAVLAWTIVIPTLVWNKEMLWEREVKKVPMTWKFLNKQAVRNICIGSIVATMLYACTDEFHQIFIEGRSGKITDVFIDTCGASLGVLGFLLLWRIYLQMKKKKE